MCELPTEGPPILGTARLQGSLPWLPSQNALFFECLQPHQATILGSVKSTRTGDKPVPRCEPSQNGCWLDLPQAHHANEPAAADCTNGPL